MGRASETTSQIAGIEAQSKVRLIGGPPTSNGTLMSSIAAHPLAFISCDSLVVFRIDGIDGVGSQCVFHAANDPEDLPLPRELGPS